MSDILEYKCPACGGAMEFDSASQKMKCPFCDTEMGIEEFSAQPEQPEAAPPETAPPGEKTDSGGWEAMSGREWQEGETAGMKVYICESCGGEIVAEESTGAASCPFCGNRVVMKGQFAGDLRPNYIIPFKLDKKAAKAAYLQHLEGKKFLPGIFKKENHIDELKGVYVPFWLFDAKAQAQVSYRGERVRIWLSGDKEYTETEYYQIYRNGSTDFHKVPVDGSGKMENTLMESIEPFDFSEAVEFQPAYLAGYVADRYDVEVEKCIEKAEQRIKRSAEDTMRSTVEGYQSVTVETSNVNMLDSHYWYALYPVWVLNTTWNKKKFTFAMNGQTGKLVGDLPVDKGAFWKYTAKWGVILGVVLYALMWLLTLI